MSKVTKKRGMLTPIPDSEEEVDLQKMAQQTSQRKTKQPTLPDTDSSIDTSDDDGAMSDTGPDTIPDIDGLDDDDEDDDDDFSTCRFLFDLQGLRNKSNMVAPSVYYSTLEPIYDSTVIDPVVLTDMAAKKQQYISDERSRRLTARTDEWLAQNAPTRRKLPKKRLNNAHDEDSQFIVDTDVSQGDINFFDPQLFFCCPAQPTLLLPLVAQQIERLTTGYIKPKTSVASNTSAAKAIHVNTSPRLTSATTTSKSNNLSPLPPVVAVSDDKTSIPVISHPVTPSDEVPTINPSSAGTIQTKAVSHNNKTKDTLDDTTELSSDEKQQFDTLWDQIRVLSESLITRYVNDIKIDSTDPLSSIQRTMIEKYRPDIDLSGNPSTTLSSSRSLATLPLTDIIPLVNQLGEIFLKLPNKKQADVTRELFGLLWMAPYSRVSKMLPRGTKKGGSTPATSVVSSSSAPLSTPLLGPSIATDDTATITAGDMSEELTIPPPAPLPSTQPRRTSKTRKAAPRLSVSPTISPIAEDVNLDHDIIMSTDISPDNTTVVASDSAHVVRKKSTRVTKVKKTTNKATKRKASRDNSDKTVDTNDNIDDDTHSSDNKYDTDDIHDNNADDIISPVDHVEENVDQLDTPDISTTATQSSLSSSSNELLLSPEPQKSRRALPVRPLSSRKSGGSFNFEPHLTPPVSDSSGSGLLSSLDEDNSLDTPALRRSTRSRR